jgi:lipid A 4'-phosphatase
LLKLYLLLLVASGAAFLLFPGLDLTVSGWFYRPGTAWELGYSPIFTVIHDGVPYGLGAVMLAAAILCAVNLRRGTDLLQLRVRGMVFVTLALLLGPGLLANVVLKDNWGRARPAHVAEFGGPSRFTPPLLIADQCDHNCSFVAGDAAAGFFLLAFALLARRRRALAIGGALAVGCGLGAVRIIQGGHFLSDVVFAGLFTGGLVWLLHTLIMTPRGDALARAAAARWRSPAGRWPLVAATIAVLVVLSVTLVDRPVARWVQTFDPAWHHRFSRFSDLGLSTGWLIGCALLALGGVAAARLSRAADAKRRWRSHTLMPLFVFASVALAGLTTDLVKALLGRFRPKLFFRDGSYGFDLLHTRADYVSFPSGHATTAFALATALTLLWPRFAGLYFLLALAIGASRVLANAHWLSDVLAGGFVGVAVTVYLRALFEANGAAPAAMRAGTASWRTAPRWRERLALGTLRRALAGTASCLPARRPLPLFPANTDDSSHGRR